ncbi:MAG: 50S ribosomal protein L11 methyltransferase, partial [Gammaproteobacteria bacterium]|nr:50S ribosomal protein L11 methyltransferase [Gammaproteobacteria bacterium]
AQLALQLDEGLGEDLQRLEIEWLQDQPWERAWLAHFKPMRFGLRLWIRPGDQPIDDPDALIIDLDPGLAFGTGTHPTTALCLEWLEQAELAGRQLLDFGCGPGILAIAGLKLGAAQAHALDHDPQAILATAAHARNT